MKIIIKTLFTLTGLAMLGITNVQASSSFNSRSALSFSIGGIYAGLDVTGSFAQAGPPDSFVFATGDASVTANNPPVLSLPLDFTHLFAVSGNVSNGDVTSSHIGRYELGFTNISAQSYNINLTLSYDLLANTAGQFANSDVILDFLDDESTLGNVWVNAASPAGSASNGANNSMNTLFTLAPGLSKTFYTDVTINGSLQASPVPLPAAVWSFLAGLLGILGLKKRKTGSTKTA